MNHYRFLLLMAMLMLLLYPVAMLASGEPGDRTTSSPGSATMNGASIVFTAVGDTYIDSGEPDTTHGSRAYLLVGGYNDLSEAIALVRFNLTSIPAGSLIRRVVFKAFYNDHCNTTETVSIYRIVNSWSPTTATWNNRPSLSGIYATKSIGVATGAYVEWPAITTLVDRWINNSANYPNYGLALRIGPGAACKLFDSLGGAQPPLLEIDYSLPTPTPTRTAPPTNTPTGTQLPTNTPKPTSTPRATPMSSPTATVTQSPARASIGGRVWHDANRNGAQDASETGMAAGTLLLERDNTFIAETTIDGNGYYTFTNLEPSLVYRVHVDEASLRPLGYRRTTAANPLIVVPTAGQNIRTAHFGYASAAAPETEQIDVWVMGIEVSQGLQDFVFTDLDNPGGRRGFADPAFANPLIPGKPAAVRVYVGLRDSAGRPPTPGDGFAVTGELHVQNATIGATRHRLAPIDNPNCSEHHGTSEQSCRPSIGAFPSLGRQGLDTHTDYDLDLIAQRIHLEGTLNFVIPPELTAEFDNAGVVITADIWPVARQELQSWDNRFELQIDNIAAPNPLNVDLVRIGGSDSGHIWPRPTTLSAQRAIDQVLQLTPYDQANITLNRTFTTDFRRIPIQFLGQNVHVFDECESLWIRLFTRFGDRVMDGRTLYGLTPAGISLGHCNGLGWKIPGAGGIGFAEIPPFAVSSALIQDTDDEEAIAVMAQELYHAHLDRRHVSNNHGEADGCGLSAEVANIVAALTNLDTDCWKPALHPHGVMGEYPPGAVKISGGTLSGRVFGDRGAMGIRIDKPVGQDWRLTLYDPCPHRADRPC